MSGDPPREVADRSGGRWAILPARDGRWRELRVPLPETAVHWFSVESMFRRGEVWRAFESFEDIIDRYTTLLEGWEKSGSHDRRIVFKALDVGSESLIKLVRHPDGGVIVSIGQRGGSTTLPPSPTHKSLPQT